MNYISYTKLSIYTISFIISGIVFIILNYFISNTNNIDSNLEFEIGEKQQNIYENIIIEENKEEVIEEKKQYNWTIEIPAVELFAEIAEGTTQNVMDKYVGHFEETSKTEGNIGLIAYSRGYENNYFENIKHLSEGDEIIYKCGDFEKTYIIDTAEIIEDTDWTYLENTEENRITLITSVDNEPKYRRCVQGVEIDITI